MFQPGRLSWRFFGNNNNRPDVYMRSIYNCLADHKNPQHIQGFFRHGCWVAFSRIVNDTFTVMCFNRFVLTLPMGLSLAADYFLDSAVQFSARLLTPLHCMVGLRVCELQFWWQNTFRNDIIIVVILVTFDTHTSRTQDIDRFCGWIHEGEAPIHILKSNVREY